MKTQSDDPIDLVVSHYSNKSLMKTVISILSEDYVVLNKAKIKQSLEGINFEKL